MLLLDFSELFSVSAQNVPHTLPFSRAPTSLQSLTFADPEIPPQYLSVLSQCLVGLIP